MTSQFLAVYYLSDLDHLLVEKLQCKYTVHYMDDLFILDTDKEKLKYIWGIIDNEIKKLHLNTNKKSNLYRLTKGVDFLGFHYKYNNYKLHISYKKKTFYKITKKLNNLKNNDLIKYKRAKASYYGYFKIIDKNCKKDDFKMKSIEIYNAYKTKYENTLVIVKEGIFYSTFRDDANILWNKFGYKHLDNKVSFGQIPYDKVISELKESEISFCVVDKEREYFKFDGNPEIYNNYLSIANMTYKKKQREDELIKKLKDVLKNNPSSYSDILLYLESFDNSSFN